jgi:osmotically-inducible protein OsmY
VSVRRDRIGPLLVTLPGVAALAAATAAWAQAPSTPSRHEASPPEVIVSATRLADEALTAKVVQVLKDDPYVYADHISVVTENGVVRLQGFATDAHELRRALLLARRAAGQRRVLNEVEFIAQNTDSD